MEEDILTLGMRADDVRRQVAGARVWYQRVHVVTPADVQPAMVIPEPASAVRLLGTPASRDEALSLLRALKEAAGPKPVSAFSLAELAERSRSGWGDLSAVLNELAAAGLTDVAELPADLLDDLAAHVLIARSNGLEASRVTVSHPLGDKRSAVLDRIRHAHAQAGGLRRVAPLPRSAPADKPTTGYEDVRMVALTRLALGHEPVSIEVDWTLYGPKLAQVALTFGADFLDAVPAGSDESLGPRRATVADVERNIRAAGFEPQEFRPSA